MKLAVPQRAVADFTSPPPTGAWIETVGAEVNWCWKRVAPSHGGVD